VARAIWSGSISFGLVNVPVKLFTSVRKKDVRFNQLHAADGVRIQQKRVCPADGEEVAWEDLVKGYEVSPGSYVVVTNDELDALDPEATHTIDIEDFVSLEDIDPLYFDSSYYLVPDATGAKPYRLLLEAMSETGRVGVGRVVLRTKQYLCAVRPLGDALVLTTMNFSDEVTPSSDLEGLPGANAEPASREMKMAKQLIDSLTAKFEPDKYHDSYRESVLELIEAKAQGQEIVSEPPPEQKAPVVDLMSALEASLAAVKEKGETTKGAQEKRRATS
jgi:DNA end-binding protein Ku